MNILYYDSLKLRNLSGSHVHVYELVTNLAKLGHNIVPLSPDAVGAATTAQAARQQSPRRRIDGSLSSSSIYQRLRGEIYILWLLKNEIHTCLRALGLMMKCRQKIDLIYRRHALFGSEWLLAKLFRTPAVREVNGVIADEARVVHSFDRFSLRVMAWLERRSLRRADRLIVVTPKMKQLFQDDYGVPENRIVVIENGANTDTFRPLDPTEARRELSLDRSGHHICFVGSLARWQGVDAFIRSMPQVARECSGARALIIGDGPIKDDLTELAQRLGVSDHVISIGAVPYGQVPRYIAASDVCVLPKKPMRTGYSPLKLCEYMACARPVVATRISGFEVLEEENAGLLVNPEDPHEFADAIVKLLKDPELRKEMGKNGRRYVVENRSWESVARRVAAVCQRAIEEHKARRGRKRRP